MGKKESEKDVQERLSSKQKDTFQFGFVLNLSNNGQTSLTELSLPKLSGTVCWCPAEEESGRNGWWRVVTYQLLLKSVNWQMKPSDLWAISKTKQKKKSELPSGKWEEDTAWQKCFIKHEQTQKHTQIHWCVHTHTHTERQCPQKNRQSLPTTETFFPNCLTWRGSWEIFSRESAGDRKTGFCWKSHCWLTTWLQANHLLWM